MPKIISLYAKILVCIALGIFSSVSYAKVYKTTDIYGRRINFSIPSNQWIVINYWATWCGACVEEIPELNKLAANIGHKPIILIAANYENLPSAQLRAFASRYGMRYPITRYNPVEGIIDQESFGSIPVTVIISPQGKINVLQGTQTANEILQAMR